MSDQTWSTNTIVVSPFDFKIEYRKTIWYFDPPYPDNWDCIDSMSRNRFRSRAAGHKSPLLLRHCHVLRHQVAAEVLRDAGAAGAPGGIVGRVAVGAAEQHSEDDHVPSVFITGPDA